MMMEIHALKRLSKHRRVPTTLSMTILTQSSPWAQGMGNPRHHFQNINPMGIWCGGIILKG
jgi:hypothetical protein